MAGLSTSFLTKIQSNSLGFTKDDLLSASATYDSADCFDNGQLVVSYFCTQTQQNQFDKHNQAATISCLGVFMVLVYLTILYKFKRASDLNRMKWDIETITPGDYTAQMEITEKAFKFFKENIYKRDVERKSDISIGESLKSYIKKELERILTEKLFEMKSDPSNDNIKISEVKIADIVFAFSNAELIQLLRTRGQHIMFQRYDKMREVEQ